MRIGIKRTHPASRTPANLAASAWIPLVFELIAVAALMILTVLVTTWFSQPALRIAAADPAALRYLSSFWDIEHTDTDSFRWSRADASIHLFGLEQRAPVLFQARLSASRTPDQPLAQLTIGTGATATRFPIRREWRRYMALLPALPRDAEARAITLHALVDPPYDDARDLGVALDWFAAIPQPHTALDRLPDPGRLAFLVALGVLGYATLRRARVQPLIPRLLVLIAMIALGGGMIAMPGALAYWLPNLWLLALTGWLALLLPNILAWLRQSQSRLTPAASLITVGAGVLLLPLQQPWSSATGWTLLLSGALILAATLPALPSADAPPLQRRTVALALAAITLLALALRLVDLNGLPLGMWRDEARHGLLALRILNDPAYRPVYVPNVADIPALLFYLDAVPISLFGAHPWTVRLVPALAGALTPLALYFAARPLFGTRPALLAAALLAVAAWSLSLSRLAFAATLGPPLTLLAIGFVWRVFGMESRRQKAEGRRQGTEDSELRTTDNGQRTLQATLAGAATGLALYTYHPSRLTPLVVAIAIALHLGWDWRAWRVAAPRLLLLSFVAALVAWPLISYGISHRASFSQRIGQTSIFNSDSLAGRAPLGRIEENIRLNLGIWNARGDRIGRHNLPDAPMLDPLTGAAFVIGAGLVLVRLGDRRALLLVLWVGVALIPGIFSIEAPHAVRTVEVIAPTMLLAAVGVISLASMVDNRRWNLSTKFSSTRRHPPSPLPFPHTEGRGADRPSMLRFLPPLPWWERGSGGEGETWTNDERRPSGHTSSIVYRLSSPQSLGTVLLIAALLLNGVRYFVAWPQSPKAYEEFFVAETHAGELIQRLNAQPEIRAGNYKLYIPAGSINNDVVLYLTSGITLETFAHNRLATPPRDNALVIDIDGQISDPQALRQALGDGAALLGSGPISPLNGKPEWTIYGRGAAAAQAVERALNR